MLVKWDTLKSFVDSRSLSIQWIDNDGWYHLAAFDGVFKLECSLNKSNLNTELSEFEASYKPSGNAALNFTKIAGNTDNTKTGNVGDRLKVDANFSSTPSVSNSYKGTNVRFDDMNASNGGVARDTSITSTVTYTQLYSYTGSGNLFGFTVSFEGNLLGADPFNVKLEIDGVTAIEVNTLDVGTATFWNLGSSGDENTLGMSVANNTLKFSQRHGSLSYASSVKVYIKKATGGSKRFRGGMMYLTKDT